MSECMTFPDTVEEFMEQYKVVDTEQVYTNGTEFVPIYRMRQWFQHEPEIVRCKDCKHHHRDNSGAYYCGIKDYGYGWGLNDFCSDAERREE